jgi:hypothetical protein
MLPKGTFNCYARNAIGKNQIGYSGRFLRCGRKCLGVAFHDCEIYRPKCDLSTTGNPIDFAGLDNQDDPDGFFAFVLLAKMEGQRNEARWQGHRRVQSPAFK